VASAEKDVVVMGPARFAAPLPATLVAWEQPSSKPSTRPCCAATGSPRSGSSGRKPSVAGEHVSPSRFNDAFLRAEDVELGLPAAPARFEVPIQPGGAGPSPRRALLEGWITALGATETRAGISPSSRGSNRECARAQLSGVHPATRWLVRRCIDSPQSTPRRASS